MQEQTRMERECGAEERVEAVLARLRTVQPAAGLEERVLQRLFARAEVPLVQSWDFPHPFAMPILRRGVLAWGAACLTALLVLAALVHHGRIAEQRSVRLDRPRASAMVQGGSKADRADLVSSVSGAVTLQVRTGRHFTRNLTKVPTGKAGHEIGEADQSSSLQLVNQPAPAEALTAQEHLLLRLGRRHAPQELMAMTPAAEEAQGTAERKQYAMFFAPAFRTVEEIEAMQKDQIQ